MATCKDCIHHKSCFNMAFRCGYKAEALDGAEVCEDFKNKADFVEVKHGYWYNIDSDVGWELVGCSVCRKEYSLCEGEDKTDYCPYCGAKMDGERRDT